jgi:hypothetical protein
LGARLRGQDANWHTRRFFLMLALSGHQQGKTSKGCGAMRTRKKVLAGERLLTAPRRIFGLSITFNDHWPPGIAARL